MAFRPCRNRRRTCNSPYISNLEGQEDYIHVWTLGVENLGDGSDKVVTIDVNPKSRAYGKVINSLSVGGRGEAHHMGFSDDRRYLWAGNLDDSKIFVFDVGSNPAKPTLVRTITDLPAKAGFHRTAYLLCASRAAGDRHVVELPGRLKCVRNFDYFEY